MSISKKISELEKIISGLNETVKSFLGSENVGKHKTINSTIQAVKHCKGMTDFGREIFKIIFLNFKNEVLGDKTLAVGSEFYCLITPKQIFTEALIYKADKIIIVHNHPSGDIKPSHEDLTLAENLKVVSKILGIEIIDNIIITSKKHVSIAS